MSQSRTRGIVLSKTLSGEADYICSIYTKDQGKGKFVFKGLKKSSRRPRSAAEPGTILDLIFYSGNSGAFNTVSEFDIAASYCAIRRSSESIFALYYMVELVDSTTGSGDGNTGIYSLLSAGIDTLSKTGHPVHLLAFFTARYMELQGILPDTDVCSWCGKRDVISIDPGTLRMSCAGCADTVNRGISGDAALYLRESRNKKFSDIDNSRFGPESVWPLLHTLTAFVENYFGIKIRSAEMFGKARPGLR